MKIKLQNIGSIKQATFELADLTIICGHNNTGKTYATYALFGFLDNWYKFIEITLSDKTLEYLFDNGSIEINLNDYVKQIPQLLDDASKRYSQTLHQVFSSTKSHFVDSSFHLSLDKKPSLKTFSFTQEISSKNELALLSLFKEMDSEYLTVALLNENGLNKLPAIIIKKMIIDTIIKNIFNGIIFENIFISSAERTGAAIFTNELDFSRNKLLKEISQGSEDNEDILLKFIKQKHQSDYALPVEKNVDFIRQLHKLFKKQSFIQEKYPQILADFEEIIGGKYGVDTNNQLYFTPKDSKIKLTMDESSSSVRSLLDVGFYLRHIAEKGDLLIIDEPELNLHPKNQRCIARLFVRLINIGVKVFITTHSDYIIKELNTLIMLQPETAYLKKIAAAENYKKEELLSTKQIKVYIAKTSSIRLDGNKNKRKYPTLVAAEIDSASGINIPSFNESIDEMNRIQDAIIWGD